MKHFMIIFFAVISTSAMAQVFETPTQQKKSIPTEKLQKLHSKNIKASIPTLPPPSKATLGLYEAAANSNIEIVDIYLAQGGDINCQNCNPRRETPFLKHVTSIAQGSGNTTDIRFAQSLIERGADINIPDANGVTALMWTFYPNNLFYGTEMVTKITDLLLKNNAKIESIDAEGRSAINHVTDTRLPSPRLQLLLKANANINHQTASNGSTLLMTAAQNCAKQDFFEFLFKANANVSLRNIEGKTALDIALERATKSGANSTCNNAVKILSNPSMYIAASDKTNPKSNVSIGDAIQGTTDVLRALNGILGGRSN